MRHMPNFRMNARGRPQRTQRFRLRIAYFSFEFALMIAARRAMPALLDLLSAERHAELSQENPGPVVRACRRDDGDVETLGLVDLRGVDLGKDEMVLDAEREIAAPVERTRRHAPEVPHARKRNVHETVEKLVHAVAAQRHAAADRHSRAQLERGARLLGPRDDGALAGDLRELLGRGVDELRVRDGFADPHVEDDLLELRDGHEVRDPELLLEDRDDVLLVLLLQTCRAHVVLTRPPAGACRWSPRSSWRNEPTRRPPGGSPRASACRLPGRRA